MRPLGLLQLQESTTGGAGGAMAMRIANSAQSPIYNNILKICL